MSWFPDIDKQLRAIIGALTYTNGKDRLPAIERELIDVKTDLDRIEGKIDSIFDLLDKPILQLTAGPPTDKE